MNSFKKYLIHRLKETFLLTLVLCIFAVIVMSTFTSLWLGTYFEWIDGYDEPIEVRRLRIEGFGLIAFIIGAACTLMPVVELGDMKNKRNADVIYSLPVSRGKMAIAHYLSGYSGSCHIHRRLRHLLYKDSHLAAFLPRRESGRAYRLLFCPSCRRPRRLFHHNGHLQLRKHRHRRMRVRGGMVLPYLRLRYRSLRA